MYIACVFYHKGIKNIDIFRRINMSEKVVLAYSGGLDTTAIIPWLKENFGYEVICCCVNCGQGEELEDDNLEERALASGASKLYIENVIDELCEDFIMPCVQAGAVYEHGYLLGTSMARPVIAKRLVEIARKEGATAICHGATGKGNDQIRFELGILALAPDIRIMADAGTLGHELPGGRDPVLQGSRDRSPLLDGQRLQPGSEPLAYQP